MSRPFPMTKDQERLAWKLKNGEGRYLFHADLFTSGHGGRRPRIAGFHYEIRRRGFYWTDAESLLDAVYFFRSAMRARHFELCSYTGHCAPVAR